MYLLFLIYLSIVQCTLIQDVLIEYRTPNAQGIVVGVDVPHPRISWRLFQLPESQQEQYQIIVRQADKDTIVWDSQIIVGEESLHILYDGKPLQGDTRYKVTVRVKVVNSDQWSVGSVFFHTGLMEQDFSGIWIGSNVINMNQLRKEFTIPTAFTEATVYISGIGYYELFLNGKKIDPSRKLDPGWTTYEVRVLYATFDVTASLKQGANAAGILLGNGWYSQDQYVAPSVNHPAYGPPRVIFQLNVKLSNGTVIQVVSDKSWMGRQSSITYDSVYQGEHYDARLDRDDWSEIGFSDSTSLWLNAQQLPAPGAVLSAQMMDPITTGQEIKPVRVTNSALNIYVFDFGQNFAGWVRINVKGPRGSSLIIRYAEIVETNERIFTDMIYVDNLRGAAQTDVYILKGDPNGETYEPRFTVHGFRYAEVSGSFHAPSMNDIVGVVVHSSAPTAGDFHSDNSVINQIQHNILWGQTSNLMSLPTDCPQRDERKGWMGDSALTVDEALFNFKLANFYENWAQNIRDTQTSDGAVPDTVPLTFGSSPADPSWGTAYPTTVYAMYDHHGDISFLQDHYPNIKKWVDFLTKQVAGSGISKMYYHYGDWVPPPPHSATNPSLVSATSYAMDVKNLAALAGSLNMTADKTKYSALFTQIGSDFHSAFYNAKVKGYAEGSQAANAMALAINAPPANIRPDVIALLADIKANGNHLTTGILGTRYLFPVLSEINQHDLAVTIITQITYPSYGYMFNNPYENATTLWEIWNAPFAGPGMNSRNHIMFGSVGAWFYRSLAGIKPNGLKTIEISPGPVGSNSKLNEITASYDSMKGPIKVHWKKNIDNMKMDVVIPNGARGRIVVPRHDSKYSAVYLDDNAFFDVVHRNFLQVFQKFGIETVNELLDGSVEIYVKPGRYNFEARL